MFDRNIHNHASHITKQEHRAPTDESIRLYHEMIEKARAEVIGTIELSANNFTARGLYRHNHLGDKIEVCIKFSLGKQLVEIHYDFHGNLKADNDMERFISELKEIVYRRVATELLHGLHIDFKDIRNA